VFLALSDLEQHTVTSKMEAPANQFTETQEFVSRFMKFSESSPTPFHVCKNLVETLYENGFVGLLEKQSWKDVCFLLCKFSIIKCSEHN
jgi:aspartyl aminopeptidase